MKLSSFLLTVGCLATSCLARPDVGLGYNYHPPPTSYGVPSGSVDNRQYYHVQKQTEYTGTVGSNVGGSFGSNVGGSVTPVVPSKHFETPIHNAGQFLGTGSTGSSQVSGTFIGPSVSSTSSSYRGQTTGINQQTFQQSNYQHQQQYQQAEVQKHLYFYTAPEEPEDAETKINIPVAPAKKNIKILFIKAPSYRYPALNIPALQQSEEKTKIYVLVKKPDAQDISVATPAPTQPSKPEVYFIKYKSQKDAEDAISHIQSGSNVGGSAINLDSDHEFVNTISKETIGHGDSNQYDLDERYISNSGSFGSHGSSGSSSGSTTDFGSVSGGGSFGSHGSSGSSSGSTTDFGSVSGGGSFGSHGSSGSSSGSTTDFGSVSGGGSFGSHGSSGSSSGSTIDFGSVSGGVTNSGSLIGNIGSGNNGCGSGSSCGGNGCGSGGCGTGGDSGCGSGSGLCGSFDTGASAGSSSQTNFDISSSTGNNGFQLYGPPKSGWYVLRNWNSADFDPHEIPTKLQVKYGISPFIRISVELDPYSPGQNIIRISPSGLGLPSREYYYRDENDRIQRAYKELIRDVVQYMGSNRLEAEKFGNDMYFYEKRIAEITPPAESLQDPIRSCNHVRVSELKDTVPNIYFYDILTQMYPEANVNESTEVLITSMEYLTAVSQIIATTDRQTMNGYLIWTLVRHYLDFLSNQYTSAMDNFNSELLGVKKASKRWEVCANVVNQFMGLAVVRFDQKLEPISNHTISVLNKTWTSILEVVRRKINKFQQFPQLQKLLKHKLSTIKIQIGLPPHIMEEDFIKNYYNGLQIIRASLFNNIRNGFEFNKKLEARKLTHPLEENEIISAMIDTVPRVVYSPSNNLITIPKSLLNEPYFESKYPKSVIYGRLGVEIANALISAVLPYGSFWTGDRKLLSAYHTTVNESLKATHNSQHCLWKYILNSNFDVSYAVANETALSILKQISAVGVANEALTTVLSSEHIHQPALEDHEDSDLFFLTYVQTQCSQSTSQYKLYDSLVNFQLPQRSLLYLIWAQLREFPESMDCYLDKGDRCCLVF